MQTWLERYAGNAHQWRNANVGGRVIHYRPLGVVESGFDSDGIYHEGRADITMTATFEIRTDLSKQQLRRRILLAWTILRLSHTLLAASASPYQDYMETSLKAKSNRFCNVQVPKTEAEAIAWADDQLVHMDDHLSKVDIEDLYHHSQNSARIVDSSKSLSKLFVLPLEKTASGNNWNLRFMFILGHQISDGLTNRKWLKHFMQLLNTPSAQLAHEITSSIESLPDRLALPQEDLYSKIPGSRARQRWFWAITLVLRYVHKPKPVPFPNPLLYSTPRPPTIPSPRTFAPVLPYHRAPVLNAGNVTAILSTPATQRLHRLCRQTSCSLGAGSVVLIAIVMMELHEARHPGVPADARQPFSGFMPVNPRPFFNHFADPDGMMLAFSDGIVLPFLSASLDLDGRIRLLVRSAQRQLSRYQKRPRQQIAAADEDEERAVAIRHWGADGAGRTIAMTYLLTVEREQGYLPAHMRREPPWKALLEGKVPPTATCGVSSVGRGDPALMPGQYDLNSNLGLGEDAFVADIRTVKMGVRPREGEFLVGVGGDENAVGAVVSYDACAIDPELAGQFRKRMETILEVGDRARL